MKLSFDKIIIAAILASAGFIVALSAYDAYQDNLPAVEQVDEVAARYHSRGRVDRFFGRRNR